MEKRNCPVCGSDLIFEFTANFRLKYKIGNDGNFKRQEDNEDCRNCEDCYCSKDSSHDIEPGKDMMDYTDGIIDEFLENHRSPNICRQMLLQHHLLNN